MEFMVETLKPVGSPDMADTIMDRINAERDRLKKHLPETWVSVFSSRLPVLGQEIAVSLSAEYKYVRNGPEGRSLLLFDFTPTHGAYLRQRLKRLGLS